MPFKLSMLTRGNGWASLSEAQRTAITAMKEDAQLRHVAGERGSMKIALEATRTILREHIADVPQEELVAFVADMTALQLMYEFKEHLIARVLERVEWTPESHSTVPIRSTWRDAVGPLLTDRRITQYQREGRYGDAAKIRILALDKIRVERAMARKLRTRARQRTRARVMARYV